MRPLHVIRRNTSAAGALAIAGTILVAGCTPHELTEARIQTTATAPMAVSCEPTQRAIVRPVVINGVTMSQVECTTTGVVAGPAQAVYQPGVASAVPVSYSPIPSSALDDARLVRAASTRLAARPVTYARTPERVAYRPAIGGQKRADHRLVGWSRSGPGRLDWRQEGRAHRRRRGRWRCDAVGSAHAPQAIARFPRPSTVARVSGHCWRQHHLECST